MDSARQLTRTHREYQLPTIDEKKKSEVAKTPVSETELEEALKNVRVVKEIDLVAYESMQAYGDALRKG